MCGSRRSLYALEDWHGCGEDGPQGGCRVEGIGDEYEMKSLRAWRWYLHEGEDMVQGGRACSDVPSGIP